LLIRENLITILITTFSCCILSSCCFNNKDTYQYISKNQELIYKQGEMLIYQSSTGLKDTLYVTQINHGFTAVLNNDYCGTSTQSEYYNVDFNSNNNFLYPANSITLEYSVFTLEINIDWLKDGFSTSPAGNGVPSYSIVDNNVLLFNDLGYAKTINSLYYDYNYGVIKYQTLDGVIWNLINQNY